MVDKPAKVHIIEVGPRDGLQNVKELLTLEQKKALIQYLLDKGFNNIERGSFVRSDKVPSMADSPQIATHFKKDSETFNKKNIGIPTDESLKVIRDAVCSLKDRGFHLTTK